MLTRLRQSPAVLGLVWGFLGMLLALTLAFLGVHAYTDHRALHEIINLINANAAAQQKAQQPSAPAPAQSPPK